MARRGEMEQVELLEHDHDAPPSVDHVDRARGVVLDKARGVVGAIRRHRVLAVATVVVIAVALVVPAALSVRADRTRTEALAALPDVLDPMPSAPEVGWTSPLTPGSYALTGRDRAWLRDDVLIQWEQTGDSTSSLRALDARTGVEIWMAPLSSVPDLGDPDNRITDDPTTCSAPTAVPGHSVVVCLVTDSWQLTPSDDAAQPALVDAASVRLRTFAAGTGEILLDLPLTRGASLAAIDADVLVAQTPAGVGPANLRRLDPSTGTERWGVEIPRPPGQGGQPYASVQVLDDEIGVPWLGATSVFTADGVADGVLDTGNVSHVAGHRIAFTDASSTVAQLRDLDTGRVLDLGKALTPWIATDDGSAPDLLLLQSDDRLAARNLATGQLAWRVDWPSGSTLSLVVVDGMLVRQTDHGLTVLDVATGQELWRRSVPASGDGMVTDGRRLLVIETVVGTGPVVAAYDARDGRRVWEAPVPVAVQSLAVIDHRLFAVGSGGVVAFGTERG